jgi:hypothetical protein
MKPKMIDIMNEVDIAPMTRRHLSRRSILTAGNDLIMHVPVLDVRILRNEIFFLYKPHAMTSLDMVIVRSLVDRGPIVFSDVVA